MAIGVFTGFGLELYASGLIYSSVVRASLLFYLTPVWTTMNEMIWLGERGNWQRWAVLLVSGGGSVPLNVGDVFAFFSSVFWVSIGSTKYQRQTLLAF